MAKIEEFEKLQAFYTQVIALIERGDNNGVLCMDKALKSAIHYWQTGKTETLHEIINGYRGDND